jgi:hypothetical protein
MMAEELGLNVKPTGWRRRLIDCRGSVCDLALLLRLLRIIYWGRGNPQRR